MAYAQEYSSERVGGGSQNEVDAKVKAEEGGAVGDVSMIRGIPVRVWF